MVRLPELADRLAIFSTRLAEAVRWSFTSEDGVIASHPRRQQCRRLLTAGVRGLGAVLAAVAAVWVAAADFGLPALALALGAGILSFSASRNLKSSRRSVSARTRRPKVRRALQTGGHCNGGVTTAILLSHAAGSRCLRAEVKRASLT